MSERSSSGFFSSMPRKLSISLFLVTGIAVGLGLYVMYVSRVFSYIGDDPSACVNCHIMSPSYQSWSKSSHANWATCKDCHTPQHNALAAFIFDAKDGLHHSAVFLSGKEPAAPRPLPPAVEVIQDNCVRCHTPLTTEFVGAGKAKVDDILHGRDKACWDCHRHVPHTKNSGLASAPGAVVPLPSASPVPDWLKKILQ